MTAAREAPTSFTAMTYKSCEPPGAMSPVSRNGQRSPLSVSAFSESAAVTPSATTPVTRAPASASELRWNATQRGCHRTEEDSCDERQDDRGHGRG